MQLEAGKKYTDRCGRIYGPMVQVHDDLFGESAEDYGWYSNGIRSPGKIRQGDLVAEYAEPAPVESPDDWVEITDPKHVLRYTDQMTLAGNISGEYVGQCRDSGGWVSCQALSRTGETLGCNKWARARCLRKDLPKVESPDDLVIQDRVPARAGIDFGWNVMVGEFADFKPSDKFKWGIGEPYAGRMHGCVGGRSGGIDDLRLAVFCYRKDLPALESPDDWVTQDRVPAREGIDFGWNVSTKDFDVYVPDDGWKWSIRDPYTGRMHGSYGDIGRLAVFCRRKDLPPVPPVVDPGEGYRLLADDEVTLPTDERAYTSLMDVSGEDWDTLEFANSRHFVGTTLSNIRKYWEDIVVRRKLPPATRTIVLKEWICWDDCQPDCVTIDWCSTRPDEDLGKFTEYDHAHPTGNTRTVEIPVT